MKTWISDGDTINVPAPLGGCISGQPVLISDWFGVANETRSAGQIVGISQFGVYTNQPKTTAEAWAVGDKLFFDTSTSRLTLSSGAGRFHVGYCQAAAAAGTTTATVIYNQGGR